MKVNFERESSNIKTGDLLYTEYGYRMVIKDTNNRFALMNLKGEISTAWFNSIEDLISVRTIKDIIKEEELELKLINN